MRRLVCVLLGHVWNKPYAFAPKFATCKRCAAVGFLVND